jgi:hypothetical protein
VAGVVHTLVLKNSVKAVVGDHVVMVAGRESSTPGSTKTGDGEVIVESDDDSHIYNIAGAVSASSGAGVGASVVVMVYDKRMEASVGDGGTIIATGDVTVQSTSKDTVILLALSFAGGGNAGVAVGASALVFENDLFAALGGSVFSDGDVLVNADSETTIVNTAAAFAVSGTAAVRPVAIVTYFEGATNALFRVGADILAAGGVSLRAKSKEFITSDAAGVSASGTASVSGTVDVVLSKQKTTAVTGSGVVIDAAALNVNAADDYQLVGVVRPSRAAAPPAWPSPRWSACCTTP